MKKQIKKTTFVSSKQNWFHKNLSNILIGVVFLIGVGLLVYPTFANWWNSFHSSSAISSYLEQVSDLTDEDFERIWQEAVEYNRTLADDDSRFIMSDKEREHYNKILDITDTGIMGYIDIPKSKISLPIYHGTDDSILQIAVGHIEGTSLPTGGPGTHCAVSGHRGLPSARLFTDIDRLQAGDHFMLQILNRTLTYEVDQIRIVLPSEMEDLAIENGKDYCTLITCTPYGVNSHRLLVRGHRVENDKPQINVVADAIQIEPVIVAPMIAVPMLTVLLIHLLVTTGKKGRKK